MGSRAGAVAIRGQHRRRASERSASGKSVLGVLRVRGTPREPVVSLSAIQALSECVHVRLEVGQPEAETSKGAEPLSEPNLKI